MSYSKSVMTAIAQQYPEALASLTKSGGQARAKNVETRLEQRFNTLLDGSGWRCGTCRRPCSDARSRANTGGTVARANCLVMWREDTTFCAERVRFVGWLWDVKGWSDEMVRALVEQEVSK